MMGEEVTSVALEQGSGLRQPEVSIAMRQLKEQDWINEGDEKKPGKGKLETTGVYFSSYKYVCAAITA
jgi:predicted transcriptional regulator